jgi:hypothetical protein
MTKFEYLMTYLYTLYGLLNIMSCMHKVCLRRINLKKKPMNDKFLILKVDETECVYSK